MTETGAEITFVGTKRTGRGFKLTAYEGKMVEYGTMFSRVAMKNGREVMVQTDCVRRSGEKNALTEAVLDAFGES